MIVDEKKWDDLSNYRDSLEHYGRKGMHWYQHIFGDHQGHAKYAKGSSGSDKKQSRWSQRKEENRKKREKEKAAKEKAKTEKQAAQKEKERQDILSSPSKLYKHRKEFTYEEIRKAMDTFKWEKELKGYSDSTLKKGADFANDMFKLMSNSINVYNQAARIVNSLYESENGKNTMPFINNQISDEKNNKRRK